MTKRLFKLSWCWQETPAKTIKLPIGKYHKYVLLEATKLWGRAVRGVVLTESFEGKCNFWSAVQKQHHPILCPWFLDTGKHHNNFCWIKINLVIPPPTYKYDQWHIRRGGAAAPPSPGLKISGQTLFSGQAQVAQKSWKINNISIQWNISGQILFLRVSAGCSKFWRIKNIYIHSELQTEQLVTCTKPILKKKEETGIKHAMFLQIDNYFKAGNRAECSLF